MTNNLPTRSITRRDSPIINQYLREISSYPVLSHEEQKELFIQLEKNPTNKEIINKLFLGNIRFVITIAKQYDNKGIPLEDLISAGNFGLLDAIENFKYQENVAFTTYAAFWIRKRMLEDLENANISVRLPDNKIKKINKIKAFNNKFIQLNERAPTIIEISEALNLPNEVINETLQLLDYQNTDNTIENDGENLSLFETLIGDDGNYDANFLQDILKRNLSERDYEIIQVFFFSNNEEQEKLAKKLGLTLRRLIQIKTDILNKLKTNSELIEFYKG